MVDDVQMLNLFRGLAVTGGTILALLVLGSMVVQNFWCRYFCPYGALMGLISLMSPLRAEGALFLSVPSSMTRCKRVPAWAVAAGVATLFLGAYAYGLLSGHWNTPLSDRVYFQLVPHANEFAHP